jgi:hypothetical protein
MLIVVPNDVPTAYCGLKFACLSVPGSGNGSPQTLLWMGLHQKGKLVSSTSTVVDHELDPLAITKILQQNGNVTPTELTLTHRKRPKPLVEGARLLICYSPPLRRI